MFFIVQQLIMKNAKTLTLGDLLGQEIDIDLDKDDGMELKKECYLSTLFSIQFI